MKRYRKENILLYWVIFIFALMMINPAAPSAEQETSKWVLGDDSKEMRAPQGFVFSVSGQKIMIKKDHKVVMDHDFENPVVCAISNPLFPCIAVFISSPEKIEALKSVQRQNKEFTSFKYLSKSLYFINIPNKIIKLWSPQGDLYFSDWEFDIWSKKGDYVALLQDHFGPISIYRTKAFMESFNIPPVA